MLNLPGQTSGSYSRNLNHLWAVGSIVLLWDAKIVEWYYAALQAGITHLSVNASTAARVIDDLDPTTIERLIEGAKKVQERLVCPDCIAHYLRRVVDAIRERVSYRYVLDDRDAILALAERARACRDFVEVRVRIRRHGQKFRARGGASMCEVLRRGKWRGPPPPAVKVALDDSLGPRPAFAPRTGQFVVP